MKYQIPPKYQFRLHHPRPRFKNDLNRLIYYASTIVHIGRKPKDEFNEELINALRAYPGNSASVRKTLDNWRTEIDALFGFIIEDGGFLRPGSRAVELASGQDLVRFFKLFCYHFQYPGGFLRPELNLVYLRNRVSFHPARYILETLKHAEGLLGKSVGLSKAEATHCMFNDLRVSRDHRSVEETWKIIQANRESGATYDRRGDIVRYAGDILDYMVKANLLIKKADRRYYINHLEDLAVERFSNPQEEFDYESELGDPVNATLDDVKATDVAWRAYFNRELPADYFSTDILLLQAESEEEYDKQREEIEEILAGATTPGDVGMVGAALVTTHERRRLEGVGRGDLKHLVKIIPDHLAVGFDVSSRDADGTHIQIEVKTTASPRPVDFNRFHLTENEWNAASTYRDTYYVYRLMVSRSTTRLFVLKDPVGAYKADLIKCSLRDRGMDVIFEPGKCGSEVTLLR